MSGKARQDDLLRLERLIVNADSSVRYYAALDKTHDRDRDLLAGLVALALVAVAMGSAFARLPVADLPTDLVLVVVLAALLTLFAWRRSLPASRYHRLSVEWSIQSFSLKRHKRLRPGLSGSGRREALMRLELDGLLLRRSCTEKFEPGLRNQCQPQSGSTPHAGAERDAQ